MRNIILGLSLLVSSCNTTQKAADNPTTAAEKTTANEVVNVDFKATGNEPFWSLVLTKEGLRFESLSEADSFDTPPVKGIRPEDVHMISYQANTESGSILVRVIGDSCTDNMSGEKKPFRVEIELTKAGKSFTFQGCGTYFAPPQLNDIWALKAIDGEAYEPGSTLQHPTIEFNIREGWVAGLDGCNSFGGSFVREDQLLRFSALMSTLKACDPETISTTIQQTLATQAVTFELKGTQLHLRGMNGTTLTYQKVD
jgi:uncharacterized membrane protein/heat shock protein HslJ